MHTSQILLFCTYTLFQRKTLAMCAGIGAPGTLREILRGYFGDKKAPERFRDDDVVKAGFITIVSRTCFSYFILLSTRHLQQH